ncbi:DUF2326 domain-containing protein [Anaerocolumna chitinilytica]|uniref:DUF2326 domain-containing protein n=1 Tax=Anaerocolumna chitinilytica TaxID=1727145 RepID=A0A7I8DI70_9FIRM|nr:DUF2326 domain-containing protein [Anaerocolumna chitinilytica]BCJ97054.1 hypothetical protein bsdcttw_00950 [Anaerocolumna chitinilytica]
MVIKELIVSKGVNHEIIRKINFNTKGLSLIVDESGTEIKKSGSNIGKTTAVKIIDICLGAKTKSVLYYEKDTGENFLIKNFIHDKKVVAELIIEENKKMYSLKRELYTNGKNYIDDEPLKYEDYIKKLNTIIFNNNSSKPSLAQLIRKFIRLDTGNEEALFKFLGSYTTNPEYQAIYTYLFGIADNKFVNVNLDQINEKIDKDIEAICRKNAVSSIEEFKAKVELLKEELVRFEEDYKDVSVIDDYKEKQEEMQNLLLKITEKENLYAIKELKKKLIEEKIIKEEKNKFTVDIRFLESIYEETKLIMKEPLKDFSDLQGFHNGMIEKRKHLLKQSLIELTTEISEIEEELTKLRQHYETKYISFNSLLREKFEEKYKKYSDNKLKLNNYLNDYQYIQDKIIEKQSNDQKKIKEDNDNTKKEIVENSLNEFFKVLTQEITGETYKLLLNLNKDEFPVQAVGLNGKPGTGIKKALIACFDMSHINLILKNQYHMPHFIIHDKLENIDLNELKGIIKEARSFEGQYIFPILSDRISILGIKENEVVLTLSADSKFFRV